MPESRAKATESDIVERLRGRAARRRELAENANNYYRGYQRRRYIDPEKIEDRSDYAQTLTDCRDIEEAANKIERLQAENATLKAKQYEPATRGDELKYGIL